MEDIINKTEEVKYNCRLTETTFELDPELIVALGAQPGDRIEIGYVERQGLYKPVIFKSEAGKKLAKKGTIRLSGKENAMLGEYGTEFTVYPNEKGVFTMYGRGSRTKVVTTVDKAVEYLSKLPIEVITDTNYNITKFDTDYGF